MSKPLANKVRLEIDASDVVNLISNHSGQAGATTGWSGDLGYTLSAVTNPTRSSQTLKGTYTGGKALGVAVAAGTSTTSRVYSPTFSIAAGQYIGVQVDVASSVVPSGNDKLMVRAGIQYYDSGMTQLYEAGLGEYVVKEDASLTGWNTVTFEPVALHPSSPAPTNAVFAKAVFQFGRKDISTDVVTFTAQTVYLTKTMAVKSDSSLKVVDVPFVDSAAVFQSILGSSTSVHIETGGDVNGVVDEIDVGVLTAVIFDAYMDPNKNSRVTQGRAVKCSRLRASDNTWVAVWNGYLSEVRVDYVDKYNQDAPPTVTITAVDAVAKLNNTPAPFGYAGTLGEKVKALMAASDVAYTTDSGTASTTKNSVEENASLWDQLNLVKNSFINAKMWIDKSGTLQCKTYTDSTPDYIFSDRNIVALRNLVLNPDYQAGTTSSPNYDGYLGTAGWSFAVYSGPTDPDLPTGLVITQTTASTELRYHPHTGSTQSFLGAGTLGASAGDHVSVRVKVKANRTCRVVLSYGSLGATQKTFADVTAGNYATLQLTDIISNGTDPGIGEARDQVMIQVFASGSPTTYLTGTGAAITIGQWTAYNTGNLPLGAASPVYFTGNTSGGSWDGVANKSISRYTYTQSWTPYVDASIGYSSKSLVNQLTVTVNNDTEVNGQKVYGPYTNAASLALYGPVSANVDVVDGVPKTLATDYLKKYQTPAVTPEFITFNYDHMLTDEVDMELYTVVTVKNAQSGINTSYYVIGIEHDIRPSEWLCKLRFRPLDTASSITVTDPPAGALGGPTDIFDYPPETPVETVYRCAGYIDVSHNLTTSGYNGITGYTEDYDEGSILNASTGLVVIPVTGIYAISATLFFNTNTTGRRFLQIEEGTAAAGSNTPLVRQEMSPAAGYAGPSIYRELTLTSGMTLRLVAYQTSGATLAARGDFSPTTFSVRLIAT